MIEIIDLLDVLFQIIWGVTKVIYYFVRFIVICIIKLVICLIRTIREIYRDHKLSKYRKDNTLVKWDDWELLNKNGRLYLKYGNDIKYEKKTIMNKFKYFFTWRNIG